MECVDGVCKSKSAHADLCIDGCSWRGGRGGGVIWEDATRARAPPSAAWDVNGVCSWVNMECAMEEWAGWRDYMEGYNESECAVSVDEQRVAIGVWMMRVH